MKVKFFRAEQAHNTWPKDGYLFENGLFISLYDWMGKPSYFSTVFYPTNIPNEINWGKGVFGAFHDYQKFLSTGEEKEINGIPHLIDFLELKIGSRNFNRSGIGEGIKWVLPIDQCLVYLGIKK